MQPTRILMTADTVGGIWYYALELARGLSEHGVEVTLATFGGRLDSSQQQAAGAVPGLTVHQSDYRLEWMRDPWNDLERAGEWLLEMAAETRPDIIHLNNYYHGILHWPAPVMMVAHSCVYSWFRAVHGAFPDPSWQRYRHAVRDGLAGAGLVVAPTGAMLATAAELYGPFHTSQVIPNGRRSAEFHPRTKRPRVLATGRLWDEGKNVAALARVAPRLAWPVRVIGDDRSPDGRRTRFPNVEWRNRTDPTRLAREYATAAIYALPARYEPFGLSILEAALAGCPLVLGDIPSLREVWGKAALYVKPDDERALTNTLNNLINNPIERQSWGVRARHRARRYSAGRMTAAYLGAYARLLDMPPAAQGAVG